MARLQNWALDHGLAEGRGKLSEAVQAIEQRSIAYIVRHYQTYQDWALLKVILMSLSGNAEDAMML